MSARTSVIQLASSPPRAELPPRFTRSSPIRPTLPPSPKLFAARISRTPVEIFNVAVGSGDGLLEFWHNDEHFADHRVVTPQFKSMDLDHSRITSVPVTSIDNFVAAHNLSAISFIKIDVQGYELAVCEGMKQTLEKFPLLSIAFEYAPDGMRELGFEPAALLQFFRSAGYQLHILTRRAIQLPRLTMARSKPPRSTLATLTCFARRKLSPKTTQMSNGSGRANHEPAVADSVPWGFSLRDRIVKNPAGFS